MGVEASIALAAISAGATIGKMSAEKEAAQADLSAINQQAKLQTVQYQQKQLQNLDVTEKILSRQAAQMSTRGVSFDSPSFNAIQRDTINSGAKQSRNDRLAESIGEDAFETEKKNVKRNLHAQLFGDVAEFSFNTATMVNNLPKSPKGSKLPRAEDL